MDKIKIELGDSHSFWFLDSISLNAFDSLSVSVDPYELEEKEIEIINKSLKRKEIKVFDSEDKEIEQIKLRSNVQSFFVGTEDEIETAECLVPQVVSMTCEEEKEEEEDVLEDVNSEEIMKEASILLDKNANTIKAMVRKMSSSTTDVIPLLIACSETEKFKRNRAGVIKEIDKKLTELEGNHGK